MKLYLPGLFCQAEIEPKFFGLMQSRLYMSLFVDMLLKFPRKVLRTLFRMLSIGVVLVSGLSCMSLKHFEYSVGKGHCNLKPTSIRRDSFSLHILGILICPGSFVYKCPH